jgi:uncharacterized DUF497 family protein
MDFEWDPDKAAENRRKHPGVSFDDATYVFLDPLALDDIDNSDPNEERWRIIGNARGRILFHCLYGASRCHPPHLSA